MTKKEAEKLDRQLEQALEDRRKLLRRIYSDAKNGDCHIDINRMLWHPTAAPEKERVLYRLVAVYDDGGSEIISYANSMEQAEKWRNDILKGDDEND